MLAIIYLSEQYLNLILGFNVAAALAVITKYLFLIITRNFSVGRINAYAILFYMSVIISSAASYLFVGCGATLKSILSLALFFGLIASFASVNLASIILSNRNVKLIYIGILFFLGLASIGISPMEKFFGITNYTDPFKESSHLAMYLIPIITYRLIKNPQDIWSWIIMAASFMLASSTTLTISVVGIVFLLVLRMQLSLRSSVKILSLAFLVIALLSISDKDIDHHRSRISGIFLGLEMEKPSLSSLVWLNGWFQAAESFVRSSGIGLGFNQMGCGPYADVGVFTSDIIKMAGDALNTNDGSFLASKLITEFGLFGILIVISASVYALREVARVRKLATISNRQNSNPDVAAIAGAFSLLIYLFVRGAGYFQFPVLLSLSMIFYRHANSRIRAHLS